jgi:putative transposon-encoded protein
MTERNVYKSDNEIGGILERTVTKKGTSANADMPSRYLGKRVYVIITKSEGEWDQE